MSGSSQPPPPRDDAAVGDGLVAVVIVGYNHRHLLAECLPSWFRVGYTPLQIIYVDNDSSDGTLEFLRAEFPHVLAVSSGGNLGYCGGNNVGIRLALEAGAEFALILNPDTTVYNPDFLTSLVTYLRDHPHVGKAGPRVFLREPGRVQNTILSWPSICGSAIARLGHGNQSAAMDRPTEVDVLNGCCVLVRTAAIRSVGLYDEEYFAYGDEAEWDWRAEQAGWKRHFVPVDSIVHHQKLTGYDFTSRANLLMKRNTALWFLNAGKPLSLLGWMAATTAIAIGRTFTAPLRGESALRYAEFTGTLVRTYAGICGRLITGRKRSPANMRAII